MKSLSFHERFKNKVEKIQKDGTFRIIETNNVLKQSLPESKFHHYDRSESSTCIYPFLSQEPGCSKKLRKTNTLIHQSSISNLSNLRSIMNAKSDSRLFSDRSKRVAWQSQPNLEGTLKKICKLPSLLPKLSLKQKSACFKIEN